MTAVDWNTLDIDILLDDTNDFIVTVDTMFENVLKMDYSADSNVPTNAVAWDRTNDYFKRGTLPMYGVISRTTTNTQVVNTVTETDLHSHTIPANAMGTNRIVRLTAYGSIKNTSGTNYDVDIKYYFGSDEITTHVEGILTGANESRFMCVCEVINAGATGSQYAFSKQWIDTGTLADAADEHVDTLFAAHYSIAEDTTADVTFKLAAQLEAANANFYINIEQSQVELL